MCCGLFGVQIVWGLQNANTSRIFQTLGANINDLAILWIAAPTTGLVLQPIIGRLSDGTWGPLGRRRPYLFFGAILTAASLVLMPNAPALWVASLFLWLLCGSINVTMEPFRALVADSIPDDQRTTAFAIQVFFIGTGAVVASAMPWILANWLGVTELAVAGTIPRTVRIAFYLGALLLLATVMWTVFTTAEKTPDEIGGSAPEWETIIARPAVLIRNGAVWTAGATAAVAAAVVIGLEREIYLLVGLAFLDGVAQLGAGWLRHKGSSSLHALEIVEDILHMPKLLRRLALVQFFTWFALFTMWIYTTPAVTQSFFHAHDPASPAYNRGADWVGVLFASYNGIAALVALAIPALCSRLGRRNTHALLLLLGAAGFLGFLLIADPYRLWIPMVGIGCAWASILSIPYAMVSSAVPPRKVGVYMGIHNLFVVIPQLAAAVLLGPVMKMFLKEQSLLAFIIAAAALTTASLLTFLIPDPDRG